MDSKNATRQRSHVPMKFLEKFAIDQWYAIRAMRILPLLSLALLSVLPVAAQSPASASIKGAKDLLAAAAPFYDFTNPSLKPWHMKATYQIYDQNGYPSARGTYEYWWASPTVYRGTWTRGAITQSEWHTADGKRLETNSGDPLHLFEMDFPNQLLAPLPNANDDDARPIWLRRDTIAFNGVKAPCVEFLDSYVNRQS